ncbi:DUF6452 family protein [Flavobacterium sp.]|uniref:DUF6452 family protein n=1 Tax=Flavobacterium sp. TaxID=239 RepID=UPI0026213851|nr:DUF6452 family protein [Flavobacterium sp.]MDD2986358.1 DUF6452 family protein [Flavobacterium sp.]
MKKLLSIVVLCLFLYGCEKDDICTPETPTTPRLIIEFYSIVNTSVPKEVANLEIKGEGASSVINFNLVSKIELPLKTNEDVTSYNFTINSTSETPVFNVDKIEINYTRKDIYISRACGFKTYFSLNLLNPIIQTNPADDSVLWIKNIEIIKNNIENEEDVHVKMYF